MTPDPMPAVLDQLARHAEQLALLDAREASHHASLATKLADLTSLLAGIRQMLDDHQSILDRLSPSVGEDPGRYRPSPVPAWWKLPADQRREPVSHLQAWVEKVYRPGYGHLAATLGPCWPAHDLCLYALHIASALWSVLYLQPGRDQPDRPGPRRLRPGTSAGVVEARGRRTRRTHRPAAGLGRAGLLARLRAPGRRPRPLLARP